MVGRNAHNEASQQVMSSTMKNECRERDPAERFRKGLGRIR